MQAIVETVFDAVYLVSVITIGILMIRGCKGSHQFKLFGLMAVVLGAGDSFHLIPRALALCTTGLVFFMLCTSVYKYRFLFYLLPDKLESVALIPVVNMFPISTVIPN